MGGCCTNNSLLFSPALNFCSLCLFLSRFPAEALPRQRIQLAFDKNYYIEPSFECRFDHIEIRDGPFGFSPLIDRFCGGKNPGLVTSTGRFMWIKFTSDEELEGLGFRVKYTFIAGEVALRLACFKELYDDNVSSPTPKSQILPADNSSPVLLG